MSLMKKSFGDRLQAPEREIRTGYSRPSVGVKKEETPQKSVISLVRYGAGGLDSEGQRHVLTDRTDAEIGC